MGFLNQNAWAGQGAAFGASNQATTTGGAVGAFGNVLGGIGGFEEANYRAQVANNNAAIMRQNASAATQAGTYQEEASKLKYGLLEGQQKAAQGANGVDVGVGSTAATRQATQTISAMDAAMIHYNAARAAFGMETEAASSAAQAKLDQRAGINALAGGLMKAGSTFMSSATSVGSRYAQYGLGEQ
jgi:hypothetical protein